jgi:hypothetical protein
MYVTLVDSLYQHYVEHCPLSVVYSVHTTFRESAPLPSSDHYDERFFITLSGYHTSLISERPQVRPKL